MNHPLQSLKFATPVRGTTDVYLILGDPVEQVRAPEAFNLIFARFSIDAVLVPVHVAPADLPAFVRAAFAAPNIKGMWVTIPHKTAIMAMLADCSEVARVACAVNAIRRNADASLSGGLFDGEGFVAALDHDKIERIAKRALILGAGGGAAAIAASLALGPGACEAVSLYDPIPGKAVALAARIQSVSRATVRAVAGNDPEGYDLVINASPLGLDEADPLPCDVSRMADHAALVDILMKNQPTPLVRTARSRGLVAQPGFEMMIQQAHLYLEFFGFHEAAHAVKQDAGFIRELISPRQEPGESPHPAGLALT